MKNKSPFVVVSFAIEGWTVFPAQLIGSLDRFDIDHDIHLLDQKSAAKFKFSQAIFLKQMLKKHAPRPIVWMNPDTVVNRYPMQFNVQSTDVALYVDEKTWSMSQVTIYMANKRSMRHLIELWIEADETFPDRLQSDNLRAAMVAWQRAREGRVGQLPFSYVDGNIVGANKTKHISQ